MNLRGTYKTENGWMVARARRWWSPKDRKVARLAAKTYNAMAPELEAQTREAAFNLVAYGTTKGPEGPPIAQQRPLS